MEGDQPLIIHERTWLTCPFFPSCRRPAPGFKGTRSCIKLGTIVHAQGILRTRGVRRCTAYIKLIRRKPSNRLSCGIHTPAPQPHQRGAETQKATAKTCMRQCSVLFATLTCTPPLPPPKTRFSGAADPCGWRKRWLHYGSEPGRAESLRLT